MVDIVHGIFKDGVAYTRRSVFAVELARKDMEAWDKRESKRIERAEKAKEQGVNISQGALLRREAGLNIISLPNQFSELLSRNSILNTLSASFKKNYKKIVPYNHNILLPIVDSFYKEAKDILFNIGNKDVQFTMAYENDIATISILHPIDNFSRKEGRERAIKRYTTAKMVLDKHGVKINNTKIFFYD